MFVFMLTLIVYSQFIFRYEIGDAYLGAVSRFMTNAFEYGDALQPRPEDVEESADGEKPPPSGSNTPYLNLATYVHTCSNTVSMS